MKLLIYLETIFFSMNGYLNESNSIFTMIFGIFTYITYKITFFYFINNLQIFNLQQLFQEYTFISFSIVSKF